MTLLKTPRHRFVLASCSLIVGSMCLWAGLIVMPTIYKSDDEESVRVMTLGGSDSRLRSSPETARTTGNRLEWLPRSQIPAPSESDTSEGEAAATVAVHAEPHQRVVSSIPVENASQGGRTPITPPRGHFRPNLPFLAGSVPELTTEASSLLHPTKDGSPVAVADVAFSELLADETPLQDSAPSAFAATASVVGEYWVTVKRRRPQAVLQQRVGENSWRPVASRHVRMTGPVMTQRVVFQLPVDANRADFRVMSYSNDKFPADFALGEITDTQESSEPTESASLPFMGDSQLLIGNTTMTTNLSVASNGTATALASVAEPVEADIWQITGSRLFFFNQFRGLQIFDLSNPAAPVKTGTWRLIATGAELFTLDADGSTLALIEKVRPVPYYSASSASRIHLIRVNRGVPTEIGSVTVAGSYEDSRLIGEQIHLVTTPPSGVGVNLATVDISARQRPVVLSNHLLAGGSPKFQAVGDTLLVATSMTGNYDSVHVFQAVPGGAARAMKTLTLAGYVFDKFKMHVVGDAVAVVTQACINWTESTKIETYPLSGASAEPLARLGIVRNETLHATRFHGSRCYVVTFRHVDPLFVLDLADPANPRVTAELVIPGWSTYLEPRGDQLLAVGVENGRVTASLFDVQDLTAPALLSRVYLGTPTLASWSAATYDEKEVEFLPAEGLLLMPFQEQGVWGTRTGIQAVNVGATTLTLAETIPHLSAKRGTLIQNHFVSVSDRELIVVDRRSSDPTPVVQMSLFWKVDRVEPFGRHLLQIETGSPPMLRITTAADPDGLIEEIELGPEPVVGIERRGHDLFLAQWISRPVADSAVEYGLRTWRLDLASAPDVRELGSTVIWLGESSDQAVRGMLKPAWPSHDRLVWHAARSIWSGLSPRLSWPSVGIPIQLINTPIMTTVITAAAALSPTSATTLLMPVKIDGETISAEAFIPLHGDESRFGSELRGQGGFLLWSYQATEPIPTPDAEAIGYRAAPSPISSVAEVAENLAALAAEPLTIIQTPTANFPAVEISSGQFTHSGVSGEISSAVVINPYGVIQPLWGSRTALAVVDFNQAVPVLRSAAPLPGKLIAVSHLDEQGGILVATAGAEIRTLAYDGVACWRFEDPVLNGTAHTMTANADSVFQYQAAQVASFAYQPRHHAFQSRDSWIVSDGLPPSQFEIRGRWLFIGQDTDLRVAEIGERGHMNDRRLVTLRAVDWSRLDKLAVPDPQGAGLFIPYGSYGVEFIPWLTD